MNVGGRTFGDARGDLAEQRTEVGEGVAEGEAPLGRWALAERVRVAKAGAAARAALALHRAFVAVQVADDTLCVVSVPRVHAHSLLHPPRPEAACREGTRTPSGHHR